MNIFCYGSLMWLDLWEHEVRNQYPSKAALVKGYRCRRVKGEFEPALIRSPDKDDEEIVEGKVYLGVNALDYESIISYHGDNYEIIEGVCFTQDSETPLSAKIFIWRSEQRSLLSTDEWSKQWFEEKALKDYRRKINQSLF